ncbi:MAG: hypothetical protein PUB42_03405 [Firmicutes bacterium]|nr:hypothetical protein [Bacillota bacterium]
MNKERIKSGVLIILILSNMVLAGKVLINKKLWPSGYNFFSNFTHVSKKDDTSTAAHLAAPIKIIVNTGYQSSRFDYNRSDGYFSEICDAAGLSFSQAFSQGTAKTTISADEWYAALTAKSIYFSYPCEYSIQTFSQLLGINCTDSENIVFSNLIISDTGNVYVENSANGTFFKYHTSNADIAPIIAGVRDDNNNEESIINYSFDLNFDKTFGNEKTLLSPLIPVYSAPVSAEKLVAENPLMPSTNEFDMSAIEKTLSVFSINTNAVSRYTEADGTLVFVENNGILKISPDGILDFSASDSGIRLTQSESSDLCTTVTALAAFVDEINSSADLQKDMTITSSLADAGETNFSFSYLVNGLPVVYQNRDAVSATVENGRLKKYTQVLRKYSGTNKFSDSPTYIDALDSAILRYQSSMSEIHITKIYLSYIDNLSIGEKNADWYVDIDNVVAQ